MFTLHPRIEADTVALEDWELSRVLLVNDRRFPWLVLVPRREGAVEIHDLAPSDRAVLIEEIARASQALTALHQPRKINVAALGNNVLQLHIHVVARRIDDAAAGGLVWGNGKAEPYDDAARARVIADLKRTLSPV